MVGYTQAKRYVSTLRDLPEEARKALREGTEWQDRDLTAESGNPFVYFCDDCGAWHLNTYVPGYAVEDGKLWLYIWDCDQDGNWGINDGAEVGTPEMAALEREYAYEQSRDGWADYHEYMARTGRDPLNDCFAETPAEVAEVGYTALIRDGYAFDPRYTLYHFTPKVKSIDELTDPEDPRVCADCGGLGDGSEAHMGICQHCGGCGVEPEYFDQEAADEQAARDYDAEMAALERGYAADRY